MSEPIFEPLPTSRPPSESDGKVLESWHANGVFQKSLEQTARGKPFVFYEGPPTANGTPHHGHVLTRVVKDLFPRYKTMDGFSVARKAGWDTHGLPVEVEVEKQIGSKKKQDIETYGVEKFVTLCKESVWKYKGEWERLTERIGFWLDLENAYVTYSPEYVDSVWWALKEIRKKGLLKKGYKILPWCPVCQTGLSNAEVGLGYQEVKDPALTVAFKLKNEDASVLAWTTTPWTLLSNIALVVGPELEYGLYEAKDGKKYWLATGCAKNFAKELGDAAPLEKKLGKELVGKRYEPLFDFHGTLAGGAGGPGAPHAKDAHKVVAGAFVATGEGTGVVHAAPAFGEDDYQVCKANDLAFIQLVGPDGTFTAQAGKYAGKWIKDADPEIIRELKDRKQVFKHDQYLHEYPHCWRTNNPLIYYARSAWFIETTAKKDEMVALNQGIRWAPEHIRDGRMGQFLAENRDWNVSRERYWASPLPVWVCTKCGETETVGSRQELVDRGATRDNKKIADASSIEPHRPWVDHVKLACPKCQGTMDRDPSVIDCWFDSGSMPFAQWGYPHVAGSKEKFERNFPASFICEAIDQTRGWFYTLHAISTLLFGKAAYEHCLVLGHVMTRVKNCKKCSAQFPAEDPAAACAKCGGPLELKVKKLSKKDKNYKPVAAVLDEHGADAIRWFFLSSMSPGQPVVWDDAGVRDARRTFLLKILNVYSFFQEYASIDGFDPTDKGGQTPRVPVEKRTSLDRWILSSTETTTRAVRAALDAFDFQRASAALEAFVDGLSNWYVRRSRDRAWSAAEASNTEKWALWWTLHEVLVRLSKLVAPFTPFLAEDLHRVLQKNLGAGQVSVHLERYPVVDEKRIDRSLETAMDLARRVAGLGKQARAQAKLPVRQPLRQAIVLQSSADAETALQGMRSVVEEELNVKSVEISSAYDQYVQFDVFPDWKSVGKRLGKRFRGKEGQEILNAALRAKGPRAIAARVRAGNPVTVTPPDGQGEVVLEAAEVLVRLSAREGFAAAEEHGIVLVLDATLDEDLRLEALVAELRSGIQGLRKARKLPYDARIELGWWAESDALTATLRSALEKRGEWLKEQTLAVGLRLLTKDEAGRMSALADSQVVTDGQPGATWLEPGDEGRVLVVLWRAGALV